VQQSSRPLADTVHEMDTLCEAFSPKKLRAVLLASWRKTKEPPHKKLVRFLATMKRIDAANQLLSRRGLIKLGGETLYPEVALTKEGYDLGRKYSRWFLSLGVWWSEYKSHCFIGILTAVGALIIERLVSWLLP
jgi:hypothetical protein